MRDAKEAGGVNSNIKTNEMVTTHKLTKKIIDISRNTANNMLDGKSEERKLKDAQGMVEELENRRQNHINISGIVLSFLGILVSIIGMCGIVKKAVRIILLIIWIGSVIIFVIRNKVLITKIIVWKEIKDKLEKKLITEMQEAIKIYKERIKDLECQKKICHVVSELMNMQRLGKSPIELEEYLIGWSLRQLLSHEGDYPEAYSVAIYHCINSKVIMGGYLSNIIGDTIPNIYRKPIPRKADKYIEYCSFKCFENKEETSLILLARDEIKKTLKNPPPRINQYANKVFNISNKHRILLEIIAYDNTVFGHNDLNPKDYLEGILNEFGHLFLGTGRDIALEQYYA